MSCCAKNKGKNNTQQGESSTSSGHTYQIEWSPRVFTRQEIELRVKEGCKMTIKSKKEVLEHLNFPYPLKNSMYIMSPDDLFDENWKPRASFTDADEKKHPHKKDSHGKRSSRQKFKSEKTAISSKSGASVKSRKKGHKKKSSSKHKDHQRKRQGAGRDPASSGKTSSKRSSKSSRDEAAQLDIRYFDLCHMHMPHTRPVKKVVTKSQGSSICSSLEEDSLKTVRTQEDQTLTLQSQARGKQPPQSQLCVSVADSGKTDKNKKPRKRVSKGKGTDASGMRNNLVTALDEEAEAKALKSGSGKTKRRTKHKDKMNVTLITADSGRSMQQSKTGTMQTRKLKSRPMTASANQQSTQQKSGGNESRADDPVGRLAKVVNSDEVTGEDSEIVSDFVTRSVA